jgi:hypothetical protein
MLTLESQLLDPNNRVDAGSTDMIAIKVENELNSSLYFQIYLTEQTFRPLLEF